MSRGNKDTESAAQQHMSPKSKLDQETQDMGNNFLRDFYKKKNDKENFFIQFEKYFLHSEKEINNANLGFEYKDVKVVLERLKAFVDKIEDINKIENITPLQRAGIIAEFVKQRPTYFEDSQNFSKYAIALEGLNKKKSDTFQKKMRNLRPNDYASKFLQWLPKYELLMKEYIGLSSDENEKQKAKNLHGVFKDFIGQQFDSKYKPKAIKPQVPVPYPRELLAYRKKLQERSVQPLGGSPIDDQLKAAHELAVSLSQEQSPENLVKLREEAYKQRAKFNNTIVELMRNNRNLSIKDVAPLQRMLEKNVSDAENKVATCKKQATMAFAALSRLVDQKNINVGKNTKQIRENINEIKRGIEIILLLESVELKKEKIEPYGNYKTALEALEKLEKNLNKADKAILIFKRVAQDKVFKEVKKMVKEQKDVFERATMSRVVEISTPKNKS